MNCQNIKLRLFEKKLFEYENKLNYRQFIKKSKEMKGSNSSEQFANIIRGVLGQSVSDDEILNRISQNLELLRDVKEILHKSNPKVVLSPRKSESNQDSFLEEKETLLSTLNDAIQNSTAFIQIKQQYSDELTSNQVSDFAIADIEFARKIRNLKCLNIHPHSAHLNELNDSIIDEIETNVNKIRDHQNQIDSYEEEKRNLESIICDLRTQLASPHQTQNLDTDPNLDSKIRALHHDLKLHNRSLSQLVKKLQHQISQLQQQIEKERSNNFIDKEQLTILQGQFNALQQENENLKEQLSAVSKEKESEAIERLLNQLNLLSQEVAELREKLIKSKDTLFANRIRMNFKEIDDDDEIVDMIGADGSLINALMRLLEPDASKSSMKEWRQKLITSIQGLEQNEELMREIRNMFTVASKENLPIAARKMKDDDEALTKRTGELLEQVLNKISDKPEIDGLIVVTFILFTTFLLKPDDLEMIDYDEIEEEEEDI